MPRIAKELTALAVSRLKKPGFHAVGGEPGLMVQVSKSGAKSWVLRALIFGKRRDMGLGAFPSVSLASARDYARTARQKIQNGIDPIQERRQKQIANQAAQASIKTFADCAQAYLTAKESEWTNPKHRQQWENTLKTYAFPTIGNMPVGDVQLMHVTQILEPIWRTKTETASRVRGRIESVLDWATVRQHRTGPNPARWKGHLDTVLASPGKIMKVEHHAALDLTAAPSFMRALRQQVGLGALALQFMILTAARSGEVRGATWKEIDLDKAVWLVPPERMKAKREHRVPLSEQALTLLRGLKIVEDCDLLFPSTKNDQLSDMTLTSVLRRMEVDAVPHGFRSTFRDWAAECTNFSSHVAEMALAHTIGDKVEAAYRRGDLLEKRRQMMQEWANYLHGVAPIDAKARLRKRVERSVNVDGSPGDGAAGRIA